MNFDVRSYCERLAKADPERWEFVDSPTCWMLWEQPKRKRVAIDCCFSASALWAFIGPLAVSFATGALTTLQSEAMPSCATSTQIFANAPANTKEIWLTIRTAGLTLRTDGGEATAGANGSDFAADASTPYVFSDDRADLLAYRAIQNGGTATGWIEF